MINVAWFLLGAIFGTVAIIVIACCVAEADTDREEENRKK